MSPDDYVRLRTLLRGAEPREVIAAILEEWRPEKIDDFLEEFTGDFYDDETETAH